MHSESTFGNENKGVQIGTVVNPDGMTFPVLVTYFTELGQKIAG